MLATLVNLILATAIFAQAPIDTISKEAVQRMAEAPITPSMADPRKLAEELLIERWLPLVTRDPDAFHTRGIEIKDPGLGEPFLEAWLQGDDLGRYRDSSVDDPRPFANHLSYAFPIHVAGRSAPVMWLVVFRDRDDNVKRSMPDDHFCFWGFYMGGGGITSEATRLREQYNGQVTFVTFVETGMKTIMVESPTGEIAGFSKDKLTTPGKIARQVKRNLQNY